MINFTCFSGRNALSRRTLSVLVLLPTLISCGKDAEPSASQAAARIGGAELTVHQINDEMARQPQIAGNDSKALSHQVLEILINQQVVANQAIEDKLDRDPNVMQAIERAKRMILVQAYLDRYLKKPAEPTDAEVREYYTAHPELFAHRRAYRLRQLSIPSNAVTADLRDKFTNANANGLDEIVAQLKQAGVPFNDEQIARFSEDLPMPLVSKFAGLQKGQIVVTTAQGPQFELVQVLDSAEQPVTEQQATMAIKRYIQTRQHNEAVDAEVKRLRAQTNIEYLGEFSAAKTVEPIAPASKPAGSGASNQEDDFIGRGAAGLGK